MRFGLFLSGSVLRFSLLLFLSFFPSRRQSLKKIRIEVPALSLILYLSHTHAICRSYYSFAPLVSRLPLSISYLYLRYDVCLQIHAQNLALQTELSVSRLEM